MGELPGTWPLPPAVPDTDLSFWLEAEHDLNHGDVAHGVAAVQTVHDIVAGTLELSQHDPVYSCWLLECCRRLKAEALANALFSLVAPGGRLALTNFSRSTPDAAYLEAVMDWWLIYRDGPGGHVVCLEVKRDTPRP